MKIKLATANKEIDNYKDLKSKAATQFANMKEDFEIRQKRADVLKNSLAKAVERIKYLLGQFNQNESRIKELKKDNENLKREKEDCLTKIKWAREHATADDFKHTQLEQEVKRLKDELAKKEKDLKSTKDETAFQIAMKADLEKIKRLSIAHTKDKEKDAKDINEYKKEIAQLKTLVNKLK